MAAAVCIGMIGLDAQALRNEATEAKNARANRSMHELR
jgi:hypothetical protein